VLIPLNRSPEAGGETDNLAASRGGKKKGNVPLHQGSKGEPANIGHQRGGGKGGDTFF